MKKEGLVDLLHAEWQRSCALLMMQNSIEEGDYECAVGCQVEYLYWHDECERLFSKHRVAYWKLRCAVRGIKWK
jgi:hypothetical protein